MRQNIKNIFGSIAAVVFAAIDAWKYEGLTSQDPVIFYHALLRFYTYNSVAIAGLCLIALAGISTTAVKQSMIVVIAANIYVILKVKLDIGDEHKWWDWLIVGVIFVVINLIMFPKKK